MENYSDQELLYMIRQSVPQSYNNLFRKYERLLWKMIHAHQLDTREYWDDAYSLCTFGFQMAVECYQETRGSFSTYLHLVVSTYLSNYQRNVVNQGYRCKYYDNWNDEDIHTISAYMYQNTTTMNKVKECRAMLHMVYDEFDEEEQRVFSMYLRGYSQREITGALQTKRYRIQYILDKFKKNV